jgi:hypothetical protein
MARNVTPAIRWKVFARDDFTCRYCGRSPPDVVLNCDHVEAVAHGGSDNLANLVTACIECNAGKGAKKIEAKPDDADKREIADQTIKSSPQVLKTVLEVLEAEGERLAREGVRIEAVALCMALVGIRVACMLCDVAPLPKRISKKRFLAICASQFDELNDQ